MLKRESSFIGDDKGRFRFEGLGRMVEIPHTDASARSKEAEDK